MSNYQSRLERIEAALCPPEEVPAIVCVTVPYGAAKAESDALVDAALTKYGTDRVTAERRGVPIVVTIDYAQARL